MYLAVIQHKTGWCLTRTIHANGYAHVERHVAQYLVSLEDGNEYTLISIVYLGKEIT